MTEDTKEKLEKIAIDITFTIFTPVAFVLALGAWLVRKWEE